jgi:uncharacterized membrane protein YwaF
MLQMPKRHYARHAFHGIVLLGTQIQHEVKAVKLVRFSFKQRLPTTMAEILVISLCDRLLQKFSRHSS